LVQAKQGEFNDAKNGLEMQKYLGMPRETLENIKPCLTPSMGDTLYPFLADQDPD
jgi:hypothetical protein